MCVPGGRQGQQGTGRLGLGGGLCREGESASWGSRAHLLSVPTNPSPVPAVKPRAVPSPVSLRPPPHPAPRPQMHRVEHKNVCQALGTAPREGLVSSGCENAAPVTGTSPSEARREALERRAEKWSFPRLQCACAVLLVPASLQPGSHGPFPPPHQNLLVLPDLPRSTQAFKGVASLLEYLGTEGVCRAVT